MKSIAVLLMVLVLVAGVAVNGSRAQPLLSKSVAFDQCDGGSRLDPKRCLPVLEHASDSDAVSLGAGGDVGGDGIDPERKVGSGWVVFVLYLAEKAAEYFQNNQYFPGSEIVDSSTFASDVVFDPVH